MFAQHDPGKVEGREYLRRDWLVVMTANVRNPGFLAALRRARRAAAEFLAAKVGISVRRDWVAEIGPITLLTVEVFEPLRDYLGGRMPITMRHAVAIQLDQGLLAYHPLVRVSHEPRRRPLRVRRQP